MGREHRSERKRDYAKEKDRSPAGSSSSRKRNKKDKNRSPSPVARSRSHTYSPSPRREISPKRRARSRSRSRDLPPSSRFGGGGGGGGGYYGSRRFYDGRDNPNPSPCLGVFGMSLHTTERDLKHLFGRYGEVESVQIVYDRYSGRSRGFGFVYFMSTKDATRAKDHMLDAVIDGMKVRVDYSVTRGGGPSSSRHMRKSISRSPVRNRSRSRSRSRSESR